ncbi:hypothetical protein BDQ17DRAFT_1336828 [Cyathus striatus]|nr:hypothetical protein BDQ17DRAFT_1336828 [Cyathus striatus]
MAHMDASTPRLCQLFDAESKKRVPGLILKQGVWVIYQNNFAKWQKNNLEATFREEFSDAVMNATIGQGRPAAADNPLFSARWIRDDQMDVDAVEGFAGNDEREANNDTPRTPEGDQPAPIVPQNDFLPTLEQRRTNTLVLIRIYQEEFEHRSYSFTYSDIMFENEDGENTEDAIPEIFFKRNHVFSLHKLWIENAITSLGEEGMYPDDIELESAKLKIIRDMQNHLATLNDSIRTAWKHWCSVKNGDNSQIPQVIDCTKHAFTDIGLVWKPYLDLC